MSAYAIKSYEIDGYTCTVEVEDISNEVPSVLVRATVNDTVLEQVQTFGPVDGALTSPTSDQVQSALDIFRDKIALAAVHRHALKIALEAAR